MTARSPWDPEAGPWVGFIDEPHPRRVAQARIKLRSYVHRDDPADRRIWGWTTNVADAIRYDSKREALAAVRRGRSVVAGVVTGAERAPS